MVMHGPVALSFCAHVASGSALSQLMLGANARSQLCHGPILKQAGE